MEDIPNAVSANGGQSRIRQLEMQKKAIANFISDVSTNVVSYTCDEGWSVENTRDI